MSFHHNSYRSPETKHEVKQAASVLTGLGVIFVVIALGGIVLVWVYQDPINLIVPVVCGGVSLLLFAAGAYNRYYTRTMAHAPFVATALRNPTVTVCMIIVSLAALIFGFTAVLIYWG